MSTNGTDMNFDDNAEAAPIAQKSRWEDYLDVFFSPADLFRRRGQDSLAVPLITLLVLATAFYYILLPAQSIVIRASMSGMTPEQAAKMPESMIGIMTLAGGLAVPIKYLINVTISAGILWVIARLFDTRPAFREMMIVTTYAGFIMLIAQIAGSLMVMIQGEANFDMMKASFGPLRFMDVKSMPGPLVGFLSRLDIFKLWEAVIWCIGFQVATGVTRSKAAIAAAATWMLWGLPGMLGGNAMKNTANFKIE
ncbi:MAG: Yip1 family protein [Longimicrobiales bacterium]